LNVIVSDYFPEHEIVSAQNNTKRREMQEVIDLTLEDSPPHFHSMGSNVIELIDSDSEEEDDEALPFLTNHQQHLYPSSSSSTTTSLVIDNDPFAELLWPNGADGGIELINSQQHQDNEDVEWLLDDIIEVHNEQGANNNMSTSSKTNKRNLYEISLIDGDDDEFVSSSKSEPASKKFKGKEVVIEMERGECPICYEDDEIVVRFKHGCNHQFCLQCLRRYATDKMKERSVPIRCPQPDCKEEINLIDMRRILSEQELANYEQYLLDAFLQNNPNEFASCLTPDCDYMFMYDPENDNPDFYCPKCRKRYCLKCQVDYHTNSTCEKYQQWKRENGQADDKFEDYAKQQSLKQCPKCKRWVQKSHGCDHMTCRCGTQFCYKCGGPYPCASCGVGIHPPNVAAHQGRGRPIELRNHLMNIIQQNQMMRGVLLAPQQLVFHQYHGPVVNQPPVQNNNAPLMTPPLLHVQPPPPRTRDTRRPRLLPNLHRQIQQPQPPIFIQHQPPPTPQLQRSQPPPTPQLQRSQPPPTPQLQRRQPPPSTIDLDDDLRLAAILYNQSRAARARSATTTSTSTDTIEID
jgi:hypothetical protein